MRINELLIENDQIDEISLGGVVGGAAERLGAVVGGARGAWDKAKQGYAAGRAAVGGNAVPGDNQSKTSATTGTATPGPAGTTAPAGTNAAPASNPVHNPALNPTLNPTANSAASAAPAATATKPAAPAPMKAPPAVAGNLEGIKKTYSTLDPADREKLKQELEIIDDQDRLASGTNESVGFSRFLGMTI
jgi:hypothetical protein